jgi:predicted Zn-dependent peptidase
MLPRCLEIFITYPLYCDTEYNKFADLFFQIAFHPKFSSSRVEKERRAILSELQMMNTIEYRVDCQASELFAPT